MYHRTYQVASATVHARARVRATAALIILLVGLLLSPAAIAATITSAASGNWSSTATWTGGVVPGTGDVVRIDAHTITIDQDVLGIKNIILRNAASVLQFDDAAARTVSFASTGANAAGSAYAVTSASWTGDDADYYGIFVSQGTLSLSSTAQRLTLKPSNSGQKFYIVHFENSLGASAKTATINLNGIVLEDLGQAVSNYEGIVWQRCTSAQYSVTNCAFIRPYYLTKTGASFNASAQFKNNTITDWWGPYGLYFGVSISSADGSISGNTLASNIPVPSSGQTFCYFLVNITGSGWVFDDNILDYRNVPAAADPANGRKMSGFGFNGTTNAIKIRRNVHGNRPMYKPNSTATASFFSINGLATNPIIEDNKSYYNYKDAVWGANSGVVTYRRNLVVLDASGRTDSLTGAGSQGAISSYNCNGAELYDNVVIFDVDQFLEAESSHILFAVFAIWETKNFKGWNNTIVATKAKAGYQFKSMVYGEGSQLRYGHCMGGYWRNNLSYGMNFAPLVTRAANNASDGLYYDPEFPTGPGLHHNLTYHPSLTPALSDVLNHSSWDWIARADFTRVSDTVFTVPGDQSNDSTTVHQLSGTWLGRMYPDYRPIKITGGSGGTKYTRVASAVYDGSSLTTVTLQDAILAADDTTISISCGDRYQSQDNAFGSFGNINADPKFRNLGGLTRDDYMLLAGSPAIGAATDGGNLGAMGVYTAPGGGGSGTTVGRIRRIAPAQVVPTRVQPRAVVPVQ